MIFRDILEVERTIRGLNENLRDKPRGYRTELKIKDRAFSVMNDHYIEIILIDPQKKLLAYRPHLNGSSNNNNKKWFLGDYKKAIKDAFAWKNKAETKKDETDRFQSLNEDTKDPEYTLMGFF
ncbi:MAG: hypothetical protein R6V76_02520 [Desulfobacterales bacterium]